MPEDAKEPLAQRLRRLRQRLGLGQAELAKRACAPLVSYRNWEYGHRVPGLAAASLLAKALGVPLQELADCVEGVEDARRQPRQGRAAGAAEAAEVPASPPDRVVGALPRKVGKGNGEPKPNPRRGKREGGS